MSNQRVRARILIINFGLDAARYKTGVSGWKKYDFYYLLSLNFERILRDRLLLDIIRLLKHITREIGDCLMSARGLTTAQSRLEALKQKHAILSMRIEEAQRSPSITDFYLKQLKKAKLILKEEIEGVRRKAAN